MVFAKSYFAAHNKFKPHIVVLACTWGISHISDIKKKSFVEVKIQPGFEPGSSGFWSNDIVITYTSEPQEH